ncbi:MAG: aspartate carbamoyltransferase regulatory subunit, partial [Candidatus Aenigmatarchaeota archaeon]
MGDKAVRAIEYGMVFDHIKPGLGSAVSAVIKNRVWSEGTICPVYTGEGVDSSRMGKKDFVKLEGVHLESGSDALGEIAVIQQGLTVNWIEGGERSQKRTARDCMGDELHTGLIECGNTNCIANYEAPGIYRVLDKGSLMVRCHYC